MTADEFVAAAQAGDVAAVRAYVGGGGDVDHVTGKGWNALGAAVFMAQGTNQSGEPLAVAKLLIDAGADLTIPTPDGWRPLTRASANHLPELVAYLFEHGDVWRGAEDWKAINFAATWQGDEAIRLLCAHGADPDTRDSDGRTPLMRACRKGHTPSVQALLDAGADPNLVDADGLIALMYAAQKTKVDNVQLLLDRGADPSVRDKLGRSALDVAQEAGRTKVVKALEAAASCL